MLIIKSFIKFLDSISEWTGRIFVWVIVLVTLLIIFEVLSRRLLGEPRIWTYEVGTFLYAIHFMLLAAYTLLYRGHVTIDLFYARLSQRRQALVDILTYLLFFFPFLVILAKVGIDWAAASWETNELTRTAKLPIIMPTMKTIMPLASCLLLLQGLSNFMRSLFLFFRGREP